MTTDLDKEKAETEEEVLEGTRKCATLILDCIEMNGFSKRHTVNACLSIVFNTYRGVYKLPFKALKSEMDAYMKQIEKMWDNPLE